MMNKMKVTPNGGYRQLYKAHKRPINVQASKVRRSYNGQRGQTSAGGLGFLLPVAAAFLTIVMASMMGQNSKTTIEIAQGENERKQVDCELSVMTISNRKLDAMVDFQGRFAEFRGKLNRSGLSYPEKLRRAEAFKSAHSPTVTMSLEDLNRELAADLAACREKK